jgi:16S rRNA (cytidine1402-2'-O)-methyltransferase
VAGDAALYVVSTPIGHLGDLTHRAEEVLRAVDVIYAEDTRRARILLRHYGIDTPCVSYRERNEAARAAEARRRWAAGASVALVADAGTPLVSDPGLRLVRAAIDDGVPVVPVPGPSAVLAALVASGLDPEPFTFYGFLPRRGRARAARIEELRGLPHTAVFFESPERLVATLDELAEALGGDRRVVVGRELTKVHEEFVRGTLAETAAYYRRRSVRGEVVVCLAGATRAGPAAEREAEARRHAETLARRGASARQIAEALRDAYGLERNRAYALALEARRRTRS